MSRRARHRSRLLVRRPGALGVATVLLAVTLAGCSLGRGSEEGEAQERSGAAQPAPAEEAPAEGLAGTFVGQARDGTAFVAVVVDPSPGAEASRAVEVFVSDGRRLGERFAGTSSATGFTARSDDDRRTAKATLRGGSLRGSVELRGGRTVRFEADPPAGAAGLYDLTVSPRGSVNGASAAGLGITGEVTLDGVGGGTVKLVDGKQIDVAVTRDGAAPSRLRAAEMRAIVLPGGQIKGAGKGRSPAGDGQPDLFIRSV